MKREVLRYLYGSTGVSFAIRMGGVGILFTANVTLARSLSQSAYGLYAYIVEIVALGAVVAALGFDQIAIRVVPDCLADDDAARLRRFVGVGMGTVLLVGLGLAAAIAAAWWIGATPAMLTPGLLALVGALLVSFTALRFAQEILRAGKRIILSQIVEQMCWPMLLLALGGAMLLGGFRFQVAAIVAIQAVAFALAAFGLTRLALGLARGRPSAQTREAAAEWLRLGTPLALAAALSVLLNRGDILALGAVVSAASIAPYTAASRYAALMILGLGAASATTAALMREYWRAGDRGSLQRTVNRAVGIATLFALPLAAVYMLAPGLLLALFGPGYVAGAPVLRILALAQLINSLTGPVALLVIVCDLGRAYTLAMAAAAIVMAALLAILVPRFGTIGAAYSTFSALALLNVGLAALVYRRTGVRCWATGGALADTVGDLAAGLRALRRQPRRAEGDAK